MATLVMGALLLWRVLTTQLTRTTMYAGLLSQVSMPYDFCVAGCIEHSVRLPRPVLRVILNVHARIGDKQQTSSKQAANTEIALLAEGIITC